MAKLLRYVKTEFDHRVDNHRWAAAQTNANFGQIARPESSFPEPLLLDITPWLAIGDEEIVERFVRASGPGGQHVNKTSTAVELRFDVRASPTLPEDVKARLEKLAGARLTKDGVIVLFADAARSQEMNRQAARARLVELIRKATVRPKVRRPTKATYSSKLKRLEGKSRRSGVKSLRGRPRGDD